MGIDNCISNEAMSTSPRSERLHITLYGKRNSGKSSLINALVGQDVALVTDTPGTTTDPVSKAMELSVLGPCLITDTAGYDDVGELGLSRVERTERTLDRTDIAILVVDSTRAEDDDAYERLWLGRLQAKGLPILVVLSKCDLSDDAPALAHRVQESLGLRAMPLLLSSRTRAGFTQLLPALTSLLPSGFGQQSITGHLVEAGDTVVLVMPQDASAPKGRLILPQVQTLRELLDKQCIAISCTPEGLPQALSVLARPPKLIITDSQAFAVVHPLCPKGTILTSFSILMAGYKGDITTFVEGAKAIDSLNSTSRVLIAEACTHAPATEDIGRVKIPAMLRRKYGEGMQIDVVSGADYPEDLRVYDLIIHCGGCMFNRAHVLSRLSRAKAQGVAITNYGICIAHLTGILSKVQY